MSEYYKKYRPKTLKGVIGQPGAVSSLKSLIDRGQVPHFMLLTGPSGTGKTTIARILKELLECGDADYMEINAASHKGIDTVREIQRSVGLNPIDGECRIFMIDEAHQLTAPAQDAFLKTLEDTPKHVYFIMATTDGGKLKKTIHTRATEIRLAELSHKDLIKAINRVVNKEDLEVSPDVAESIAEASEGSPRKALVILDQVGSLGTEEEQMDAIKQTVLNKEEAINLARGLMFGNPTWPEIAKILRGIQDQDAEGIRYLVLGYANSVLLGKGKGIPAKGAVAANAFKVIEVFSEPFYNSKMPGLTAAAYECVTN